VGFKFLIPSGNYKYYINSIY